ncbi:M20/M25/M40 family metallo-hydrolase [[Eubacterium] cellulosolvens]
MRPDVQLLKGALEHYSPTGKTDEMGKFLIDWSKEHGLEAELQNGMVVINPKASDFLMLGHMDTVPGELSVEMNEGVITGRGAADAKGPLCAAIAAVEKHMEYCDKVCIVAVPDEEGPSEAAKALRDNWSERPCIILEPSTWYGVTLSYMGRLFVRCTTTCPPSHSGHLTPFAAEVLSTAWNTISKQNIVRIRTFQGNETEAEMTLDIRFRDMDGDRIVSQLPEDIKVDIIEKTPPYTAAKNTPLTRAFLRAIRDVGGKPVFKKKTGTSDMNVLGEKWSTPMLAYGPGDGKLGHTNLEQIEIEDYLNAISVLEKTLGYLLD